MKTLPLQILKDFLGSHDSFSIFLPAKLTYDHVASALALYLSLQEQQKQVNVYSAGELIVDFSHLVGLNKIQSKLNGKDLVISLEADPDSVERVSYKIENQRFNLVIHPKVGQLPPDPKTVKFSQAGAPASAAFFLGTSDLKDLGSIYSDNQSNFDALQTIALGKVKPNFPVTHDLTDPTTASSAETTTQFMQQLNLPVNSDIATNLFLGLTRATDNFQSPSTTADSFYIASVLIQSGARRSHSTTSPQETTSLTPETAPISASEIETTPIESVETKPAITKDTPSDWLQPKIFKT